MNRENDDEALTSFPEIPELGFRIREKRSGSGPFNQRVITGNLEHQSFASKPEDWLVFEGARLRNVDFRSAKWRQFVARGSTFERCDFSGARLRSAWLGASPHSLYLKCRFDGADLQDAIPEARFEQCSFDRSRIKGWISFCGEFVECSFATRIERSKFSGRPTSTCADHLEPVRLQNDFARNDFRKATLVDVSFFNGIDIDAQLWPEDREYIRLDRFIQRLEKVREEVISWPPNEERRLALTMIEVYEGRNQDGFFARRDDLDSIPANVRNRVWDLLERAGD